MLKAVSNILYDLPPTTWDQIQLINTTYLPIGATVKATDLYMHTFIWDGSNWQSLNNGLIKVGSSRTAVTLLGATSTVDQIAYAGISVPASLQGNGGKLVLDSKVTFGSLSAAVKGISVQDSSASTNVMYMSSAQSTARGIYGRNVAIWDTTTSINRTLSLASGISLPFFSETGNVSLDTTVQRTYNIRGIVTNSAESITIYGYDMYVERRI